MSEQLRQKAGLVYNVVESVILAMSVGLMVWVSNIVIAHGNTLSSQATSISTNSRRLDTLETFGSRGLGEHERDDNTRIEELKRRMSSVESAVIALQATPGELKSIAVRLDSIREGQSRIEKAMDEHLKKGNL